MAKKKIKDIITIKKEDLPRPRKPMPPPTKTHKKRVKYNRKKDKKIKDEELY